VNALDAAVYSRLAGGTALTAFLGGTHIYTLLAKDGVKRFVEFGIQGGGDEHITPVRRKNQVVRVKAVSNVSKADAGSADAYAESLLLSAPLSVNGWNDTFWLARETDFETVEVDEAGQKFWHVGGMYRLQYDK
jgi:hypothetical protein